MLTDVFGMVMIAETHDLLIIVITGERKENEILNMTRRSIRFLKSEAGK